MSDAPNDPDVNQMMAVFDKLSRQADTAKNEMAMAVNSFVGRAQDIIAAKIAENAQLRAQVAKRDEKIAELRAQVAERDATIERYAMESVAKDMRIESLTASLEDMRNRWKDAEQDWMQLREQVADLWTQLADRDATVASLVERLNRCTCTDDFGNVT
jgi:chromosome segregation ATPase